LTFLTKETSLGHGTGGMNVIVALPGRTGTAIGNRPLLPHHRQYVGLQEALPLWGFTEVDPDHLRVLYARLMNLLRNDDFGCVQLLNENEPLLRSALDDRLTLIAGAIHNYDFAAAIEMLNEALASSGISQ
jgi:hypothetical protein